MPPKKAKAGPGAGAAVMEEDLSDVAGLPPIYEFIFTNIYSFKYKKNKLNLEKTLFKHLFVSPEGETAELSKTQKVIQQSDLLAQAQAKSYLTAEEATNIEGLDPIKMR
jgi:hypothetical protein